MKQSKNIYHYPFSGDSKIKAIIEKVEDSHVGPWKGAIDFAVPLRTRVLAALDGIVISVVDKYNKFGLIPNFAKYYNYIQLKHINGEFTEYGHLGQNSSKVKIGDKVKRGCLLAFTGKSGWMTEPHLHFLVFKFLPENKPFGFEGEKYYFKGLKPRFNFN